MTEAPSFKDISVLRMRVGVVLIALWWLPAYLLAPTILAATGNEGNHDMLVKVTLAIVGVQTLIGLVGTLLLGKQIVMVVRRTPRKKLPKTVWHLFWRGTEE